MRADEFERKVRHYARMARSCADEEERARFGRMAAELLDTLRAQLREGGATPTMH